MKKLRKSISSPGALSLTSSNTIIFAKIEIFENHQTVFTNVNLSYK